MNALKSLRFLTFVVAVSFSAMFTGSASAVTVRVVEGGTVGLDDAGYFAGVVTLDIDGEEYLAMMTDSFYNIADNPTWYTDYTTTWETNIYTRDDILAGVTTPYAPEEYSMAAPFFLDGLLGYNPADPLWTASFNEMVWEIIDPGAASDGSLWWAEYANRVYDEASGLTLSDVFDSTVAAGLDLNYDYNEFMLILDGGQDDGPNMLIFGSAVSSVPIPSAIWLFGSGLIGFMAVTRKRKKNLS